MEEQVRFDCEAESKKLWEKAARDWAKSVGLPADRAVSAWMRTALTKAAEEQLKKKG